MTKETTEKKYQNWDLSGPFAQTARSSDLRLAEKYRDVNLVKLFESQKRAKRKKAA